MGGEEKRLQHKAPLEKVTGGVVVQFSLNGGQRSTIVHMWDSGCGYAHMCRKNWSRRYEGECVQLGICVDL